MKKFLFLLALVGSLFAPSAFAELGYITGAWYETKVPSTELKIGGNYNITLHDNGTITGTQFYNGEFYDTMSGVWRYSRGRIVITITDGSGWSWAGSARFYVKADGTAATGTFRSPTGQFRGKWLGVLYQFTTESTQGQ